MTGLRPDDGQRRHELHQWRIVVIEPKCPLLPVGDARRHVHHFIDGRVLLKQAASGQCVMERQEPDHGEARRDSSAIVGRSRMIDRRE